MIKLSLLQIGLIFLPGCAVATDLIKSDNPTGRIIVTFVPGFLDGNDSSHGTRSLRTGGMSVEDKIRQEIQGGVLGAKSHGDLDYVFNNGFAGPLDEVGLQNILNSPNVALVEEDGVVDINQVTWGLDRIDDKDLPLDGTYTPTFGNNGAGVTAYVIDTGILDSHVDFEGRATQEYNSVNGDPNEDCNGHGTHVAGTIGSKTYGVANKAKLVGVKVLSCSGSGSYAGVIAGIEWVQNNAKKPATANMSLGGGKSTSVNNAVKALVQSGVTTVVAAGNSNADACNYSPASEPDAITVGATTNADARASFSNWGSCVDIFAPGQSITAPWIGSNTALRTISGTSMASPHVCGATALYLGNDNSLSPDDVVKKMLDDSIDGTITGVKSPTNKFLYVAADQAPTTPTTSAPNRAPTTPTPAPTRAVRCEGKNKSQCKKLKQCVFGKNKIPGKCGPKKSKYKKDCGQFNEKDTCLDQSGGNCKWDGECIHRCDGLAKTACKKVRNPEDNNRKMCSAKMLTNPCKGCQPKTTCG